MQLESAGNGAESGGHALVHGAQPGEIERLATLLEDLDESRHVRALDVVREADVHAELRDRMLDFAVGLPDRHGIAKPLHADALDGQLAPIGQRLGIRQRQVLGGVHESSCSARCAHGSRVVTPRKPYAGLRPDFNPWAMRVYPRAAFPEV